jgi:hypothetical protein
MKGTTPMSEASGTEGASGETGTAAAASDAAAGAAGGGAPEGFVPVAQLEAERAKARDFQARYDKLQAAASAGGSSESASAGGSAGAGAGAGAKDFDLDAFRQSLVQEVRSTVLSAGQERDLIASLKTEFPKADPSLFEPARVAQFANLDAFRFAVQDNHARVVAIVDEERAAMEAKLREELGLAAAGAAGVGGTQTGAHGEPTIDQLLALSTEEFDALAEKNPGMVERILSGAASA